MANTYTPTIGLEIHAELNTHTKMFCRSKNDADETRPNVNICPVCMAHPGVLPVINAEAVKHVLRVGIALGSKLADYTEFDRKNYFYPDLPKGYQLSQFDFPLVAGGSLHGVEITRVHLEEDTASSIHDEATGATLVDYNRAGVPLMELVTKPVIRSAEQAGAFARELQILLRDLGASEANMEKGEMRVEANVSISKDSTLGTKVEIKNLNSFRAMERAVDFEIKRQTALLDSGGVVVQQTLGWDDAKQSTFPQRIKEGSADYRYFPDPDLPSLKLSELGEFSVEALRSGMPELPAERRARYVAQGARVEDADLYVRDSKLGSFFDIVSKELALLSSAALASNYIANDLVKIIRDAEGRDTVPRSDIPISAHNFVSLMNLLVEKKISSRVAKDLLAESIQTGEDPRSIATQKSLFQADSSSLETVVIKIIDENPVVVTEFKSGKDSALEFLVGQCMKTLRGAGDAQAIRDLLRVKLA